MAEIISTLSPGANEGTPANGGGFYSQMRAWEADQQGNLTTTDNTAGEPSTSTLRCYGFVEIDNTGVSIGGWITDATHFIRIEGYEGGYHNGVARAAGGTGYRLVSTAPATLNAAMAHTQIYGIEIANAGAGICIDNPNVGFVVCDSLICENAPVSTNDCIDIGPDGTVSNCLLVSGTRGIDARFNTGALVENCTLIAKGTPTYGLMADAGVIFVNNVVFGWATGDYFGAAGAGSSNNASEDGTAASQGDPSVTGVQTTDFVNYQPDLTGDFTPATDGRLDGAGFSPTRLPLDIGGNTRRDPDDIGAYALVGAGPTPTITFTGPEIADQTGTDNTPFVMSQNVADSFTVENGTAAYALSPSSNPLPAGLSVDSQNGDIIGTPSVPGIYANIIVRGTVS